MKVQLSSLATLTKDLRSSSSTKEPVGLPGLDVRTTCKPLASISFAKISEFNYRNSKKGMLVQFSKM